jgi:hypothetical protein
MRQTVPARVRSADNAATAAALVLRRTRAATGARTIGQTFRARPESLKGHSKRFAAALSIGERSDATAWRSKEPVSRRSGLRLRAYQARARITTLAADSHAVAAPAAPAHLIGWLQHKPSLATLQHSTV